MSKMSRATILAILFVPFFFSSCTPHKQHRTNFEVARVADGTDLSDRVFEDHGDHLLAHVEFDDQGQFWEDQRDGSMNQLDALEHRILGELKTNRSKYRNGAVMVVFVHGWNNNAKEGNGNLEGFRMVMDQLAQRERRNRPVIGVYLSWRGERAIDLPVVNKLKYVTSYWDRKETAENIGHRSMGETLKRLAVLKDEIIRVGEAPRPRFKAHSRLVVIGHSFGGAAVFSGVSRFFEDELIRVKQKNYRDHIDRNWDLVVLVNPAFEALQYKAIHRLSAGIPPRGGYPFIHMPRMLVISAKNDKGNGWALPAGQTLGDLFRPRQKVPHLDQTAQMRTALGHYEPFRTHRLVKRGNTGKLIPYRGFKNVTRTGVESSPKDYSLRSNQGFLQNLEKLFVEEASIKRVLPFSVVEADSDVVNGHNGIWQGELQNFVIDFIDAREAAAQSLGK